MNDEITVNIDPENIESKYSDIAFINFTPFGFTIDFGQHLPQMKTVKVVSRISLSPHHAKVFADVLGKNVQAFEGQFGKIEVSKAQKEMIEPKIIGFNQDKKDD